MIQQQIGRYIYKNVLKPINEQQFKKFTKDQRSTFQYWYYHWKAFNLTALSLDVWKFKYLFHDIEKPWLKLFWPYWKVQVFHRTHNAHHLEYRKAPYYDYEAMVIDWECSGLTKVACPRTAIQEIKLKYEYHELSPYEYHKLLRTANELGLTK